MSTIDIAKLNQRVVSNLTEIRRRRGISAKELSDATGLSVQDILHYESGLKYLPAAALFRLAEYLETPLSDFFVVPATREFVRSEA